MQLERREHLPQRVLVDIIDMKIPGFQTMVEQIETRCPGDMIVLTDVPCNLLGTPKNHALLMRLVYAIAAAREVDDERGKEDGQITQVLEILYRIVDLELQRSVSGANAKW